jgi:hypothetical protein
MFGYIKIHKPQLRFCEFEMYKALYCGICKQLIKDYGYLMSLSLNYDFCFVAMLSLNNRDFTVSKLRCSLNPLRKCPAVDSNDTLSKTSAAAAAMLYYKLRDNYDDGKLFDKIICAVPLMYARSKLRKSAKVCSHFRDICGRMYDAQKAAEASDKGIDYAADPTAMALSECMSLFADDEDTRRIFERIGYLLGRWVYIIDALDDLERDRKKNRYNPFIGRGTEDVGDILRFTESEIAAAYNLLPCGRFSPVLENIIYEGLRNVRENVNRRGRTPDALLKEV